MLRRLSVTLLVIAALTALAGCASAPQGTPPRTVIRMTATRGAGTQAPAAAATQAPAATQASGGEAATPAPQAQPTAASSSSSTVAGEKVTLDLAKTLSTVEQVDEIKELLHETPGILSVTGNEISITFEYDPALITVQGLVDKMKAIGHEVKAP